MTQNTKSIQEQITLIQTALEDVKAKNITVMNVSELTEVTDYMIIANATSTRHVKALSDHVSAEAKAAGLQPLNRNGTKGDDWILVDLGDVLVHVMTAAAREFYDIEGLWSSAEELAKLTQPDPAERRR